MRIELLDTHKYPELLGCIVLETTDIVGLDDRTVDEVYPKNASAKRLCEFATGRRCAKLALQRLGIVGSPMQIENEKFLDWPTHTTGSISHTQGRCGAAVASSLSMRSMGYDVQSVKIMTASRRADLIHRVFTDHDCHAVTQVLTSQSALEIGNNWDVWTMLIFSSKESVYKCIYPMTKKIFGFLDVSLCEQIVLVDGSFSVVRFVYALNNKVAATLPKRTLTVYGWIADGFVRSLCVWPNM